MKRKALITILCLTIGLSIAACGKQTQQQQTQADSTEQKEETVQTEEVYNTEQSETETIETTESTETTDEVTDNIVYPDVNPEDVDPKTTNMDAETAHALGKQEHAEIQEKYGSVDDWIEYAKSQGADSTGGWCWIYYTGQGAGSEESYAVYMKEDSARYKEIFHLGDYLPDGTLFTGANMEEMGIADDREFQRMYESGAFGDGLTIDDDGTIIIN